MLHFSSKLIPDFTYNFKPPVNRCSSPEIYYLHTTKIIWMFSISPCHNCNTYPGVWPSHGPGRQYIPPGDAELICTTNPKSRYQVMVLEYLGA